MRVTEALACVSMGDTAASSSNIRESSSVGSRELKEQALRCRFAAASKLRSDAISLSHAWTFACDVASDEICVVVIKDVLCAKACAQKDPAGLWV